MLPPTTNFPLSTTPTAQESDEDRTKTDHFAVILSGSKGFWNYRHQAQTCELFHKLKKNGILESNIIHFSYDDAARDKKNPFRG
jgi:legumain